MQWFEVLYYNVINNGLRTCDSSVSSLWFFPDFGFFSPNIWFLTHVSDGCFLWGFGASRYNDCQIFVCFHPTLKSLFLQSSLKGFTRWCSSLSLMLVFHPFPLLYLAGLEQSYPSLEIGGRSQSVCLFLHLDASPLDPWCISTWPKTNSIIFHKRSHLNFSNWFCSKQENHIKHDSDKPSFVLWISLFWWLLRSQSYALSWLDCTIPW